MLIQPIIKPLYKYKIMIMSVLWLYTYKSK